LGGILNKKEFIDFHLKRDSSKELYAKILGKFSDFENELGMDLYDFDEEDILEVLEQTDTRSPEWLNGLASIYKYYIDWAANQLGRTQSHARIDLHKLISDSGLDEKTNQNQLSTIFTREQLRTQIVSKIYSENYVDKAIISLAFEGIGGANADELLGLKSVPSVNGRWVNLSDRKILLTKETAYIVKKAIEQTEYYEKNGESLSPRGIIKLSNNDFVLRTFNGKFKSKNSLYSRLNNNLTAYTGFNLSLKKIHKAGILDYFFLIEAKSGQKLSSDDAKRVCIWFGENIETNNNWCIFRSFYKRKYKEFFQLKEADFESRSLDDDFDGIYEQILEIPVPKQKIHIVNKSSPRQLNVNDIVNEPSILEEVVKPLSDQEYEAVHDEGIEKTDIDSALEYFKVLLNNEPELTEPNLPTENFTFSSRSNKARNPAFGIAVKRVYDYTCAICGSKLRTPKGHYEVQAAHIYPKSLNGKDDIRNGICLCRMHHWALDVGWIAISDNYSVIVKDTLPHEDIYDFIRSVNGSRITLPLDKKCYPHSLYFTAFRKYMEFE
jgi:hypothetical protein